MFTEIIKALYLATCLENLKQTELKYDDAREESEEYYYKYRTYNPQLLRQEESIRLKWNEARKEYDRATASYYINPKYRTYSL
jgi:hypothetical protein